MNFKLHRLCTGKVFASSVVGASLEEETEDIQPPSENSTANQNFYEVVGTLNDQTNQKPDRVSEIIPVRLPNNLCSLKHVLKSCTITNLVISLN